jgi:hypothetical protein
VAYLGALFCSFVAGGFVVTGATKKGVFAGDDMSASISLLIVTTLRRRI